MIFFSARFFSNLSLLYCHDLSSSAIWTFLSIVFISHGYFEMYGFNILLDAWWKGASNVVNVPLGRWRSLRKGANFQIDTRAHAPSLSPLSPQPPSYSPRSCQCFICHSPFSHRPQRTLLPTPFPPPLPPPPLKKNFTTTVFDFS